MKKIGVVILAGGYGTCRSVGGSPFPKVVEKIGGMPMICHVVGLAPETYFSPRIVVVNPIYEELIETAIAEAGLNDCAFVVQPRRSGAAEAVRLALPSLEREGADDFLVIYGDMPLWRPETLTRLVETHLRENPVLSMVTVERHHDYPMLDHYGRIIRDRGDVCRIVEPADASSEETHIRVVNPSLWVWRRQWFAEHVDQVSLYSSQDCLGRERFLPPLVAIAHSGGEKIVEIKIDNPIEAIGVNTLEDLGLVHSLLCD